jgi:hypothetical protein
MMVLCWAIIEKSWTAVWSDDGTIKVVGVSITQMSSTLVLHCMQLEKCKNYYFGYPPLLSEHHN